MKKTTKKDTKLALTQEQVRMLTGVEMTELVHGGSGDSCCDMGTCQSRRRTKEL